MNHKILFIILISVFESCDSKQYSVSSMNNYKLTTEYSYWVNPNDTTQKFLTDIYINDSCGNETEHIKYKFNEWDKKLEVVNGKQIISDKTTREYEYKNNCIPTITLVRNKNSQLIKKFIYTYGPNGLKSELKIVDSMDNQTSRTKYFYNSLSNLTKKIDFDKKNDTSIITQYYFKNDHLTQEVRIYRNSLDTLICNYIYDYKGNLVVEEWKSLTDLTREFDFNSYDSNKNKIGNIFFDSNAVDEYRNVYYANGLEKYWVRFDTDSGKIKEMILSKYKHEK